MSAWIAGPAARFGVCGDQVELEPARGRIASEDSAWRHRFRLARVGNRSASSSAAAFAAAAAGSPCDGPQLPGDASRSTIRRAVIA